MRLTLVFVAVTACAHTPPVAPVPEEARWLLERQGDERFVRVAAHLRGLDLAMSEVGVRYAELFWAGGDRNWDLATYQLGKLELALARGLERRPKRAASAAMFSAPVAVLREALVARDPAAFDQAFAGLTASCNACHAAEQVGFMHVTPPTVRASVLRYP